jgi:lipoyl(octanoyl) transferase
MEEIALRNLSVQWLGCRDYEEGLRIQTDAVEVVKRTNQPQILSCEHPTVITLGKRGQPLTDILTSMDVLREQNIKIIATDRGGQATLHNPGQLVIYPILPLREVGLGVRQYVECLERATAHFLAEYGIEVTRGFEPGLFAEGRKIAAFGIRIDRGVTLHGLAININNDLETFSLIRQCGQAVRPTNLQNEMELFGVIKRDWDFAAEAEKWKALFLDEIFLCNGTPPPKSLED